MYFFNTAEVFKQEKNHKNDIIFVTKNCSVYIFRAAPIGLQKMCCYHRKYKIKKS
jgi:hypothetical protein